MTLKKEFVLIVVDLEVLEISPTFDQHGRMEKKVYEVLEVRDWHVYVMLNSSFCESYLQLFVCIRPYTVVGSTY